MSRRLAWTSFAVVALGLVGALAFSVFIAMREHHVGTEDVGQAAVLLVAMFSFPVVGVLIASRQPRNAIGWLLLGIGFVWEVGGGLGTSYAQYAFVTDARALPGAAEAAVLG